ncbi:MAG: tetraacyldisaccharide 4'-kinase, partial [Pseudomonadota bacterium]
MKPPAFWRAGGEAHIAAQLLKPAAALYAAAHARNLRRARAEAVGVPIICIGNATLGGTGKTPATLALAAAFSGLGWRPHILSRGHGGALKGPLAVGAAQHRAADVGDEALLHANAAPAWVSRDRVAGARAAAEAGAGVILMDDGYQNPSLTKDVSILVIDAEAGFGNGLGFPAGPLRESPPAALSRADAVLFTGPQGAASIPPHLMRAAGPLPKFRAWLEPEGPMPPGPYLAFAGIGRPERFFTL